MKTPSRHKMALILLVVVTCVSLPLSVVITTYLGAGRASFASS